MSYSSYLHNIGYGHKNTKNQGWNLTGFTECLRCNYKSHDLSEEDVDDLVRDFQDEYQGQYNDEEDFAYQIVEECYDLPEFAKNYFDYKQFARDLFMCDYWFGDGFVFRAI